MMSSAAATPWQVFLFAPNLIDYGRAVLLGAAFWFFGQPSYFLVLYAAQMLLDGQCFFVFVLLGCVCHFPHPQRPNHSARAAVDGHVARRLNQTSAFGAWVGRRARLFWWSCD
jgi:hypothetical protein